MRVGGLAALLAAAKPPHGIVMGSKNAVVLLSLCVHMTSGGAGSVIESVSLQPEFSGETTPCPHNCSGHGQCHASVGKCVCFAGWTGSACAESAISCNISCSGHGWCVPGQQRCLCDEFWRGANCELPASCPNACSGFGHCVNGKSCRCDAEHTGADCSRPIHACPGWPRSCGGFEHGVCGAAGACLCRPAWRGSACEISAAYRPCRRNCSWPHGLCDPEGSGTCQCTDEWEGSACERRAGSVPLLTLVLRMLCVLALLCCCAVGAMLTWCFRVRGLAPRDVLRGQWHIRKEEGWRREDADGMIAGARFERFGEWIS